MKASLDARVVLATSASSLRDAADWLSQAEATEDAEVRAKLYDRAKSVLQRVGPAIDTVERAELGHGRPWLPVNGEPLDPMRAATPAHLRRAQA